MQYIFLPLLCDTLYKTMYFVVTCRIKCLIFGFFVFTNNLTSKKFG